ncbi:hypothetical protein KFK09_027547 [Dendrobium nobile]|uniref:Uncharacterized protein n=1 Tax=Dendrobium nobile TaxID=94219 RepID=A0A8T3AB99_DENNO|nr:hypothetical protein KFK09_027547 [Dendrobium nobile]
MIKPIEVSPIPLALDFHCAFQSTALARAPAGSKPRALAPIVVPPIIRMARSCFFVLLAHAFASARHAYAPAPSTLRLVFLPRTPIPNQTCDFA